MHRPARLFTCALLTLTAACGGPIGESLPGPRPEGCDRSRAYAVSDLTDDLAYLASPELDGRAPGTEGDVEARAFVAERFACLGLDPADQGDGYDQPFTDSEDNETGNVLALLPGSSDEIIAISAHIDHFGYDYLGANDNASGVTALLAMAQDLVNRGVEPDRTILFGVFGAEESGYEGSERFMSRPPSEVDVDQIVYNVNLDMVGSYAESETLYVFGSDTGSSGRQAVAARRDDQPGLDLWLGEESLESDNVSFCARGVPYLFFWTEDRSCYHRRCDTSARIDFDGLAEIAQLAGDVALDLAGEGTLEGEGCE